MSDVRSLCVCLAMLPGVHRGVEEKEADACEAWSSIIVATLAIPVVFLIVFIGVIVIVVSFAETVFGLLHSPG